MRAIASASKREYTCLEMAEVAGDTPLPTSQLCGFSFTRNYRGTRPARLLKSSFVPEAFPDVISCLFSLGLRVDLFWCGRCDVLVSKQCYTAALTRSDTKKLPRLFKTRIFLVESLWQKVRNQCPQSDWCFDGSIKAYSSPQQHIPLR